MVAAQRVAEDDLDDGDVSLLCRGTIARSIEAHNRFQTDLEPLVQFLVCLPSLFNRALSV
jgi:hypothetical protein